MKEEKHQSLELMKREQLRMISIFSVMMVCALLGFVAIKTFAFEGTLISGEVKENQTGNDRGGENQDEVPPGVNLEGNFEEIEEEELSEEKGREERDTEKKEKKPEQKKEEKKSGDSGKKHKNTIKEKDKINSGKRKRRKTEKKDRKDKSQKNTLIIGDSIAYGMSLRNNYTGVDKVNDFYWLTEGGVGINFISKDLQVVTGRTMPAAIMNTFSSSAYVDIPKESKKKKIQNIALLLGLNGSGEKSAEMTVERMIALKEKTKCDIYFISVLPIVDDKAKKYGYAVSDSMNQSFNGWVKEKIEGTGIIYVNAYEEVKKNATYRNHTSDGIHYSKVIYNKVINLLDRLIRTKEKKMKSVEKWKKTISSRKRF